MYVFEIFAFDFCLISFSGKMPAGRSQGMVSRCIAAGLRSLAFARHFMSTQRQGSGRPCRPRLKQLRRTLSLKAARLGKECRR